MDWYIAVDNKPKKIPETILIYKIKNKEISEDTLVVNSDIKEWVPLKETKLYKDKLNNESSQTVISTNENTNIPTIKCPECLKEISAQSLTCSYCGYPLKTQIRQGKAIFQTSNDFIGLLGKYTIKDKEGNVIAKLKANDYFETNINADTTFYIRYSGAFTTFKEAFAPAGSVSRFSIGLSGGGTSFYVTKI